MASRGAGGAGSPFLSPLMNVLIDLLSLRDQAFRHACTDPAAPRFAIAFIALAGIVYGALVAIFQRSIAAPIYGVPIEQIPNWVLFTGNIVAGLVVAVVAHAGLSIVVWLMARAVGGPGLFPLLYRITAYLLLLALPALPRLAFAAARPHDPPVAIPLAWDLLALAAVTLVLFGLYRAFRVSQETTAFRAGIAAILTVAFTASVFAIA